jgi:hypothetical protein
MGSAIALGPRRRERAGVAQRDGMTACLAKESRSRSGRQKWADFCSAIVTDCSRGAPTRRRAQSGSGQGECRLLVQFQAALVDRDHFGQSCRSPVFGRIALESGRASTRERVVLRSASARRRRGGPEMHDAPVCAGQTGASMRAIECVCVDGATTRCFPSRACGGRVTRDPLRR